MYALCGSHRAASFDPVDAMVTAAAADNAVLEEKVVDITEQLIDEHDKWKDLLHVVLPRFATACAGGLVGCFC